jgi:periplasmic divalent cation tolerance protein
MLDPLRQASNALGRVCSILMNYGERADRCAPSAKTIDEADAVAPEPPDDASVERHDATYVEIRFAVADETRADEITRVLLAERLVACGQRIGPIVSRYWWSGTLERNAEWLVLTKTRSELADRVIETIVAHHPYETPEVVALPVVSGLTQYLDWIDTVTIEPGALQTETAGRDGVES